MPRVEDFEEPQENNAKGAGSQPCGQRAVPAPAAGAAEPGTSSACEGSGAGAETAITILPVGGGTVFG